MFLVLTLAYWFEITGLCSSPSILKEHNVSGTVSVSFLRRKSGESATQLSPFERVVRSVQGGWVPYAVQRFHPRPETYVLCSEYWRADRHAQWHEAPLTKRCRGTLRRKERGQPCCWSGWRLCVRSPRRKQELSLPGDLSSSRSGMHSLGYLKQKITVC